MPVIDFTQIEGPKLLPDGVYLAKIVHAEDGLSASNNPKQEIRWEIIAPEEAAGRMVFDNLSYHPDQLWRVKLALIALGFDETFQGDVTAGELVGREAAISVVTEKGKQDPEGNQYPDKNKVRKIMPVEKYAQSGGTPAAMDSLAGLNVPSAVKEEPTEMEAPQQSGGLFSRRGRK
jgi:hypothetical protein